MSPVVHEMTKAERAQARRANQSDWLDKYGDWYEPTDAVTFLQSEVTEMELTLGHFTLATW